MGDYTTGKDILKEKLKAKIISMGREEVFQFAGVRVKMATKEQTNNIMDNALSTISNEMLYEALENYGLMPTYTYTGPEPGVWSDEKAYKEKKCKTPTGSIVIEHPLVKMMCRVADDPSLPGFIITCKDDNGENREFHIYLSPNGPSIRVCTSSATNQKIADDDIVRKNYNIPFECGHTCSNCHHRNEEGICYSVKSDSYTLIVSDNDSCKHWVQKI